MLAAGGQRYGKKRQDTGRRGGFREPYPSEERSVILRQARQLLATTDMTVTAVARRLGVNQATLSGWLRRPQTDSLLPVTIVPLTAVAAVQVPQPVFIAPNGFRVEGLDLEGVADLLRRLS